MLALLMENQGTLQLGRQAAASLTACTESALSGSCTSGGIPHQQQAYLLLKLHLVEDAGLLALMVPRSGVANKGAAGLRLTSVAALKLPAWPRLLDMRSEQVQNSRGGYVLQRPSSAWQDTTV